MPRTGRSRSPTTRSLLPLSSLVEPAVITVPTGSPLLTRSTIVSVRRALNAFRDGWATPHLVERAAGHIADDARRSGASAAQMVVALKQAWWSLADVRNLAPDIERQLREMLVSCSIEAYYAAA